MKPNLNPVPPRINGLRVVAHRPATQSPNEICYVVLCANGGDDTYVTWTWNAQSPGAHRGNYGMPLDKATTQFLMAHDRVDTRSWHEVRIADDAARTERYSLNTAMIPRPFRPDIVCECGATVSRDGFTNTCRRCGADYNSAGQRLASREQWGEETGEQSSDVLVSDEALSRALNGGE